MKSFLTLLIPILAVGLLACGSLEASDSDEQGTTADTSRMLTSDSISSFDDPIEPLLASGEEKCIKVGGSWIGDCIEYDPDDNDRCVNRSVNNGNCRMESSKR